MEGISPDPDFLSEEAMKPATIPSLAERMQRAKPPSEVLADKTPKRRGRPPGSKNATTIAKAKTEAIKSGFVKPGDDDDLTPSQKHEARVARGQKLGTDVADTINDNLMLLLMSMGMPAKMLYMPGHIPEQQKDPKYTVVAQQLTVSPFQANIIGRFLAEMEATETGGKLTGSLSEGKGPLIIYGILSLAVVGQYVRGLTTAYKQFEPLLKEYMAQQQGVKANPYDQHQTGG